MTLATFFGFWRQISTILTHKFYSDSNSVTEIQRLTPKMGQKSIFSNIYPKSIFYIFLLPESVKMLLG